MNNEKSLVTNIKSNKQALIILKQYYDKQDSYIKDDFKKDLKTNKLYLGFWDVMPEICKILNLDGILMKNHISYGTMIIIYDIIKLNELLFQHQNKILKETILKKFFYTKNI